MSSKPSDPGNSGSRKGGRLNGKSKAGGIAVVLLLGAYSFAAPQLNARYGWKLPALGTDDQGNVRVAESPGDSVAAHTASPEPAASHEPATENQGSSEPPRSTGRRDHAPTSGTASAPAPTTTTATETTTSPPTTTEKKKKSGSSKPKTKTQTRSPGPLSPAARSSASGSSDSRSASSPTSEANSRPEEDLLFGLLREVSHDRFVSPAGLLYTPGSAEGHRLEHLRRHIKDDPGRPGSHGVFDGKMEGALKTIDRAYERAKKGQRTTKKVDDGRTIYTVDMGGRIGYVGGRDGGRRRKPMARRVRLVLEGNRVITAYPM